jgi:hypothetical protein
MPTPVLPSHGRLKSRLRPMRGLEQLCCTRVISAGHAFVQNLPQVPDEKPRTSRDIAQFTCSTYLTVGMKRNLTIQLDADLIRQAKVADVRGDRPRWPPLDSGRAVRTTARPVWRVSIPSPLGITFVDTNILIYSRLLGMR